MDQYKEKRWPHWATVLDVKNRAIIQANVHLDPKANQQQPEALAPLRFQEDAHQARAVYRMDKNVASIP